MSHILVYDGQYFRVYIAAVENPDAPDKTMYVSWCSNAFKNLKAMPNQACSRFIAGPSLVKYDEARRQAHDWIKANCDSRKGLFPPMERQIGSVVFTVWLFKNEDSSGFEFERFADAQVFAKAAEKSLEITKVGITNNESPEYLTIWKKTV